MDLQIKLLRKAIYVLEKAGTKLTKNNEFVLPNPIYDVYHDLVEKRVEKILSELIDGQIKNQNIMHDKDKKNLWILWWQVDKIPYLVLKNIESVKRHTDHNVILLNEKNFSRYLDIPKEILDKVKTNKISLASFSDYIRTAILYEHGGIWLDSTIFVAKDIPDEIFKKNFFTAHGLESKSHKFVPRGRWTIYLIGANSGKKYFEFVNKGLEYYMMNDIKITDYFLVDYLLDIAYTYNIGNFRSDIANLNINNREIESLNLVMNDEFEMNEYLRLISNTYFFKLSNKKEYYPKTNNNILTYYGKLFK